MRHYWSGRIALMLLAIALRSCRRAWAPIVLQGLAVGAGAGVVGTLLALWAMLGPGYVPGAACAPDTGILVSESERGASTRMTGLQAKLLNAALPGQIEFSVRAMLEVRSGATAERRNIEFVSAGYFALFCVAASSPEPGSIILSGGASATEERVGIGRTTFKIAGRTEEFSGVGGDTEGFVSIGDFSAASPELAGELEGFAMAHLFVRPSGSMAELRDALERVVVENPAAFPGTRLRLQRSLTLSPEQEVALSRLAALAAVLSLAFVILLLFNTVTYQASRSAALQRSAGLQHALGVPGIARMAAALVEPLMIGSIAACVGLTGTLAARSLLQESIVEPSGDALVWLPVWAVLVAFGLTGGAALWRIRLALRAHLTQAVGARRQGARWQPYLTALQSAATAGALGAAAIVVLAYLDARPGPTNYRPEGLWVVELHDPMGQLPGVRDDALALALRSELESFAGGAVALSQTPAPLVGSKVTWQVEDPAGGQVGVALNRVTANFFEVIGLRVDGEVWEESYRAPEGAEVPDVAIINSRLAKRLFGDRSPLGQPVHFAGSTVARVVGVVDEGTSGNDSTASGLALPATVYMPLVAPATFDVGMTVWTRAGAGARPGFASRALELGRHARRELVVYQHRSASAALEMATRKERRLAQLISMVSGFVLFLGALGAAAMGAAIERARAARTAVAFAVGTAPAQLAWQHVLALLVPTSAGALIGACIVSLVPSLLAPDLERFSLIAAGIAVLGVLGMSAAMNVSGWLRLGSMPGGQLLRGAEG